MFKNRWDKNNEPFTKIVTTTIHGEITEVERTYDPNNTINEANFLTRIKKILKGLGIEQSTENIKTHCFRKWFRTMIKRAEPDPEFREHLIAHKAQNLASAYNQDLKNREFFFQEWYKVESFLSIDYVIVDKTDDKVIQLEKDFAEEKAKKNAIIESQAKELIAMREKLASTVSKDEFNEMKMSFEEIREKFESEAWKDFQQHDIDIQDENGYIKTEPPKKIK